MMMAICRPPLSASGPFRSGGGGDVRRLFPGFRLAAFGDGGPIGPGTDPLQINNHRRNQGGDDDHRQERKSLEAS